MSACTHVCKRQLSALTRNRSTRFPWHRAHLQPPAYLARAPEGHLVRRHLRGVSRQCHCVCGRSHKKDTGWRVDGRTSVRGTVAFPMGCPKVRLKTEEDVHMVERCRAQGPGSWKELGQELWCLVTVHRTRGPRRGYPWTSCWGLFVLSEPHTDFAARPGTGGHMVIWNKQGPSIPRT